MSETPESHPTRRFSILIVDDEQNTCSGFSRMLADDGYEVTVAANALEALGLVRNNEYHVIVSDWHMPRMDGLQFLHAVRRIKPAIPFIMFTAYGEHVCPIALREGANACLGKPVLYQDLIQAIQDAMSASARGNSGHGEEG